MKKYFLFAYSLILFSGSATAQEGVYVMKMVNIALFSSTPMEDIVAKNKYVEGVIRPSDKLVQMKVHNIGFVFEKSLMQEHFHENYMETEKFPHSIFKGKIVEEVDWKKDGTTPVTINGKMTMHGVTKDCTIKGSITMAGGKMNISAKFNVIIADYGIKVPSILTKNIAEIIEISITASPELVTVVKKK